MEALQVFVSAAMDRTLCELTDASGNRRVVQPYLVYVSQQGTPLLHCYQVSGYSEGRNKRGWKNLKLEDVSSASPTAAKFQVRADYNPSNPAFVNTVFALPLPDESAPKKAKAPGGPALEDDEDETE